MARRRPARDAIVLMLAAGWLAACSGSRSQMGNPLGASGMYGSGPQGTYASNGERIYFTATSASGSAITYTGGFVTPMGRLTCAMCHGPTGHGASTTMMGALVQAPDITWPALTGPHDDHAPYTVDTVKAAITGGVDPAGHALDTAMPRWTMTAADLDDLVSYLQTLR